MKSTLSGRADLIRALVHHNTELTAGALELLGYSETLQVTPAPKRPRDQELPPQSGRQGPVTETYEPDKVPFWRLDACEVIAADTETFEPIPESSPRGLWRLRPTTLPDREPLAPQHVVLARLDPVIRSRHQIYEIDVDAVVDRISQGQWLRELPLREKWRWNSNLHLIIDRSRRLTPYWQDQDDVTRMLQNLYPPYGLTVAYLGDGESCPVIRWPEKWRGQAMTPLPGTMVLVLGDLGCLATSSADLCRFWRNFGYRLAQRESEIVALMPAQAHEIPQELARLWRVVGWETELAAVPLARAEPSASVADVLTLLSPAVRVEPSLLRTVRGLLPGGRGDPGLEARVWQDDAFSSQHSVAASWKPDRRQAYLARFAGLPEGLRQALLRVLRRWRGHLHPAIWFEEIIGLSSHEQVQFDYASDLADAKTFLTSCVIEARRSGRIEASHAAWLGRLTQRLPESACDDPEIEATVHELYNLVRPREMDTAVPRWFNLARLPLSQESVRSVALWQVNDQLVVKTVDARLTSDRLTPYGSPLAVVQTASGEVMVSAGHEETFWPSGVSPDWAESWGYDASGLWATFRIGEVEQRMRWIGPGRFWMGSPEDEEERYADEGPRHEVELSQGFWLFDTPCTQALWQAVMDENPSEFEGANRPVEQVSWDDCQVFISKLNDQFPELSLSLPTEAQWEYACRAGTEGARYDPNVDAIAWYDENSNDETHDVAQKLPNAWGLYDMLGNVDEWVSDWHSDYPADVVVDPSGPESGADRVIRGGSWDYPAQSVRAAFRLRSEPGYRYSIIGFRCLSSGSEPVRARASWHESERQAERAETRAGRPAARLLNVQREPELSTVFPDADFVDVSTDHERLRFARITRPSWAKAIGRDGFGLWVRLEVQGVPQRLRWIAPGRFWMGSPEDEEGRFEVEGPRHEVELSQGFWLFDTACTQALWQAVMDENPSEFEGANRPVEQVSWDDCQVFISKLNDQFPELSLSLPTEAQWEYACRAGTEGARYDPDLDAIAWYEGNETHEVGQKRPNGWGLYDMLGNVYEWCHDGKRDYESGLAIDPVELTEAGADRVFRGGCWGDPARLVRAAYRFWLEPGVRGSDIGFRCLSSGVSQVAGMRRARSQAESGARADRDRSDDGEGPEKERG